MFTHIEILLRHIQGYSGIFSTLCNLANSQPFHILSPGIFKTGGLLKTLSNVDQAYSEPCHRALFSHIQAYSEPCAMVAYAEAWHIRNPQIFRTLAYFHNCNATHIQNPVIFTKILRILRIMTYLKPETYSEPSQK